MLLVGQVELPDIESLGQAAIIIFILAFLLCIAIMVGLLWLGWWVTNRQGSVSPYTGSPMRRGEDLAFSAQLQVQHFLNSMEDPDNPVFALKYAAICKDTGRIFPDCVDIFRVIKVDWGFLQRRCRGHWVSWGSLSPLQKEEIAKRHQSLSDFQIEESSVIPRPQDVDGYHAMKKPGPLYVDPSTGVLLGWKIVPETQLEVLVVQKPKKDNL